MLSELSSYIDSCENNSILLSDVEYIIEKPLSTQFVQDILMLKEIFNFDNERILEFVRYLKNKNVYSHNYIIKVAQSWADNNIRSILEAQQNIDNFRNSIPDVVIELFKILEISADRISPKDIEYYNFWKNSGFEYELILEACNRTKDKAKEPSFAYMNRILLRWGEQKIHTCSELESVEKSIEKKVSKKTNSKIHNFEERKYDFDSLLSEIAPNS